MRGGVPSPVALADAHEGFQTFPAKGKRGKSTKPGAQLSVADPDLILCVGFACSLARLVFTASARSGMGVNALSETVEFKTLVSLFRGGIQLASSIGPPLVRLRI